ncbi:MAG TPA: PAS domain-containing sensor histidine kinase [Candidatus Dormibacteraeota bacterium]|nr:PAS domain-containing sensor histidine kinase [Candidatus Dormibacteraeota bacterium]
MRRFWIGAGCALGLVAAYTVYVAYNSGNDTADIAREVGQALTALGAAATCGWAAMRSTGRLRWAWAMLATSGLATLLVEVLEAVYRTSAPEPAFLNTSEVAVAGAMPFAIAGLLLFPPAPNSYATRLRALLDGAMVALSLLCISLLLSLPVLFVRFGTGIAPVFAVSVPLLDVTLLTVIFVVLRRSQAALRQRIVFVVTGLAVIAIADGASVFVAATGRLEVLVELFGAGSLYGFALVALAPLWPEGGRSVPETEKPVWQELIPYIGVFAVALTAVIGFLTNLKMSALVAIPASGLVGVLVGSELLNRSEARAVLRESRRIQARLRDREALLNNVIDHAPQGVAAISVQRRITNANPRLASMLYAPLPMLVGASTDTFLPEDYVSRVFKSFPATPGQSPEGYESDCQAQRADGSQFWVHWSTTPIRKADGAIDYFMATFEDVTAKREAEELSAANLAQLEKLNRLKSEFVSMVSHEFRTALVGIQGFSELIRDQEIDASEMRLLADEIYNDSQRLNRMITEMLDFDRLEAGKLTLDLKPLALNELVQAAVEHASVTTKKHVIRTNLQKGMPAVLADSDRITQVMTNLLSNAIKYSPNGGEIRVATRVAGPCAEVSVLDHGRGIPSDFISRLFGRYERYEDKHAGKIIGTGLGLAITRQIVEMHGGRVAVDSNLGKGSEFRFTVPLAQTAMAVSKSVTRSA